MKTVTLLALAALITTTAQANPVTVKVTNVRATSGAVYISVFPTAQSWADEVPSTIEKLAPLEMGTSKITLDLAPGDYAFFLYDDVNADGTLQRNWMGLPAEPYAFSNNFVLKLAKPTFDELKFSVNAHGATQTLKLIDP